MTNEEYIIYLKEIEQTVLNTDMKHLIGTIIQISQYQKAERSEA